MQSGEFGQQSADKDSEFGNSMGITFGLVQEVQAHSCPYNKNRCHHYREVCVHADVRQGDRGYGGVPVRFLQY